MNEWVIISKVDRIVYREPKLKIKTDKRSRLCLVKKLIAYRKRLNISRENLALSCDIDVKYLSRIENGSANVSLDVLDKLSRGTGIAVEDLIAE